MVSCAKIKAKLKHTLHQKQTNSLHNKDQTLPLKRNQRQNKWDAQETEYLNLIWNTNENKQHLLKQRYKSNWNIKVLRKSMHRMSQKLYRSEKQKKNMIRIEQHENSVKKIYILSCSTRRRKIYRQNKNVEITLRENNDRKRYKSD